MKYIPFLQLFLVALISLGRLMRRIRSSRTAGLLRAAGNNIEVGRKFLVNGMVCKGCLKPKANSGQFPATASGKKKKKNRKEKKLRSAMALLGNYRAKRTLRIQGGKADCNPAQRVVRTPAVGLSGKKKPREKLKEAHGPPGNYRAGDVCDPSRKQEATRGRGMWATPRNRRLSLSPKNGSQERIVTPQSCAV